MTPLSSSRSSGSERQGTPTVAKLGNTATEPGGLDTAATLVIFSMDVNREDLARNDCPPPEEWEPKDAAHADSLGPIYGFASEIRDAPK